MPATVGLTEPHSMSRRNFAISVSATGSADCVPVVTPARFNCHTLDWLMTGRDWRRWLLRRQCEPPEQAGHALKNSGECKTGKQIHSCLRYSTKHREPRRDWIVTGSHTTLRYCPR